MLNIISTNPTELWKRLGENFFYHYDNTVDLNLGNRRFVSINNLLVVKDWPKEWTGKALYDLVGYSGKGSKMATLRETYLDQMKWIEFQHKAKQVKVKGYAIIGMQFKMTLEKKGGCLSSCHLLQTKDENILFIQGKVAEVPRKFTADLMLVRDMVHDLNIWPIKVHFLYSTIYYSIVNLRALVPVFGRQILKKVKDLPILEHRNYHVGTIERLNAVRKDVEAKYPRGCINYINPETGELNDKIRGRR